MIAKILTPLVALITACGTLALATSVAADWPAELQKQLPRLGHRNWIVVADSAYPSQTAPGITTIATNASQVDVVRQVLATVDRARHVDGVVFLDAELDHVAEKSANGIDAYRAQLKQALKGRATVSLPHEQIISKLDEAGKTFHVVVLKTNLTLPYTSVFIRLDCGYWSEEAEQQLRAAMQKAGVAQ